MTHPDHYGVGLLGLAMLFVLTPATLVLTTLVGMSPRVGRLVPTHRSRAVYRLGIVVMAPFVLAACILIPRGLQALAVIASFGPDAYRDGLHVVNKHGQLSDGRFLSTFWAAATGALIFPLAVIFITPLTAWVYHFKHKPGTHQGDGVSPARPESGPPSPRQVGQGDGRVARAHHENPSRG